MLSLTSCIYLGAKSTLNNLRRFSGFVQLSFIINRCSKISGKLKLRTLNWQMKVVLAICLGGTGSVSVNEVSFYLMYLLGNLVSD